ncbi:hypothetical protein QTG56_24940 (plasmid) [Rossellomorea sp. AcN35-11]|nr:hypothetical protein [Rossellomorea aquimaris]WJV31882.1 hypothetical protein QTG56_24940 [Rossellomorea sp. AcN35-11]
MGKARMSIQEGLNEINTLESRIDKALSRRMQLGTVVIGDKTVNGYKDNNEFEKAVKSTYDSVRALIERRTLIKRAIVKKNAEVEVSINGRTMTLAEAIDEKNQLIPFKESLLLEMQRQYTSLMKDLGEKQEYYRNKLDKHIETAVGKDNKDKVTEDNAMLKFFKEQNEPVLIDPINLREQIDLLEDWITEFKEKYNNIMTAANVTNDIEFEEPSKKDD